MSPTLTPELMAEASWRLGSLGLLYAGGYAAGHFGRRAILALTDAVDVTFQIQDAVSVVAITIGIAVYVVSRRGFLPPKRLLDCGLAFEVVGAFGLALNEFW